MARRKVDIIYNSTLVCPWDCDVCCVDAVHVKRQGSEIHIRSEGLAKLEIIPLLRNEGSAYDQALRHRQSQGSELHLEDKKRIIDHLSGFEARIDISGGDALSVTENFELLRYAASTLGRENVTLTVTGAGSSKYSAEELAPYISEYNFTFDAESLHDVVHRPKHYAEGNLAKAKKFVGIGVPTRAETPLTREILSQEHLERLYTTLATAGVQKLLIMRLFAVGRGTLLEAHIPSAEEYRFAIRTLRDIAARIDGPLVKLQCALRHLVNETGTEGANPCDLGSESFGLMADGTLLASPWAINNRGKPLGEEWVLGNLADQPLSVLLETDRARELQSRANENFGHCKIFAAANSSRSNAFDRLFDQTDPLLREALI
jgi:MoaA/NifB/PqqE/SkfB family radical SAM enzyme